MTFIATLDKRFWRIRFIGLTGHKAGGWASITERAQLDAAKLEEAVKAHPPFATTGEAVSLVFGQINCAHLLHSFDGISVSLCVHAEKPSKCEI